MAPDEVVGPVSWVERDMDRQFAVADVAHARNGGQPVKVEPVNAVLALPTVSVVGQAKDAWFRPGVDGPTHLVRPGRFFFGPRSVPASSPRRRGAFGTA